MKVEEGLVGKRKKINQGEGKSTKECNRKRASEKYIAYIYENSILKPIVM